MLIGAYGISLVGAGVFAFDPAWGYPPGAPPGLPEDPSWHSTLHGIAFGVVMGSLIAACFVFARRFAAQGDRGWAAYSAATGVARPTIYLLAGALADGGENPQPLSLLLRAMAFQGPRCSRCGCAARPARRNRAPTPSNDPSDRHIEHRPGLDREPPAGGLPPRGRAAATVGVC